MSKGKNKKVMVMVVGKTASSARKMYPQAQKGEIVGYTTDAIWKTLNPSQQKQYSKVITEGEAQMPAEPEEKTDDAEQTPTGGVVQSVKGLLGGEDAKTGLE